MRRYGRVGTGGAALRDCLTKKEAGLAPGRDAPEDADWGPRALETGRSQAKAENQEKPGVLGLGSLALPPARLQPGSVA